MPWFVLETGHALSLQKTTVQPSHAPITPPLSPQQISNPPTLPIPIFLRNLDS